MRILGLDPGSRYCGYGVIDDAGATARYVECGVLTAPATGAMEQRLGEIARGLREVIDELAPDGRRGRGRVRRTRTCAARWRSRRRAAWRSP